METLDIERPTIWAAGDAAIYLKVSPHRVNILAKKYNIPNQMTSSGRVFLKADILHFQESRKERLKHRIDS